MNHLDHAQPQVPRLVLWRPHVGRQVLAIIGGGFLIAAASTFAVALVLDWRFAPTADDVAIFVMLWFAVSIIATVVVLVRGDLQQPGFVRRAAHVIELTPHGIRLHDPIRGHSAAQADGSLHVFRSNVYGARGSLHGGLALQSTSGTLLVHPWQRLGAWSGLPVAPSTQLPLAVNAQFFNAMLRLAA